MLLLTTLFGCAKKVKLTIDGTVPSSQTTLYLIVNEDTANARQIPINDGKFSVSLKVDKNDIIRLHDSKQWPERSPFVLIPDSRHITVDGLDYRIEGSPLSQRLQAAVDMVRRASPEGFHVDVFSEDKEAWAEARAMERKMREQMLAEQRQIIESIIRDNRDNIIPAWIVYCYPELVEPVMPGLTLDEPKWANHPVLQKKK